MGGILLSASESLQKENDKLGSLDFFDVDNFFKVFIEFVTILLLSYVLGFFGCEACGILAPRPGIKPTPLVLEGEGLTTGLPWKSQAWVFKLSAQDMVRESQSFHDSHKRISYFLWTPALFATNKTKIWCML